MKECCGGANEEAIEKLEAENTDLKRINAAYVERLDYVDIEYSKLRDALKSLANEADGFMSMADPMNHGVTNMQCLLKRIVDARELLK